MSFNPGSPWELFHPDGARWPEQRRLRGKRVTHADIVRIINADENNVYHPAMREFVLAALRGQLAPTRGRPAKEYDKAFLAAANIWIEEWASIVRRWRARPGRSPERGMLEPRVIGANRVARDCRLPIDGRALLNVISSYKIR